MEHKWRRTETRIVRPFIDVEGSLKDVCLRLNADEEWDSNKTTFDVEDIQNHNFQPEFQFGLERTSKLPYEIEESDVAVVVSLEDIHLHRRQKVLERQLNEIHDLNTWTIPSDICDKFAWTHGIHATVALILNNDREAMGTGPCKRGQWLDRKIFSITSTRSISLFNIQRWTAKQFEEKHLPKNTTYWIDFLSDDLYRQVENSEQLLLLAFRDKVYDSLVRNEKNNSGKSVIQLIYTEIFTDILWFGLKKMLDDGISFDDEGTLEEGSVLYNTIKKISKSVGKSEGDLVRKFIDHVNASDRASLRAYVQSTHNLYNTISHIEGATRGI